VQWTDEERPEPFTEDPDDHRSIVVQLWYPAEETGADRAFGGRETIAESREVMAASADFFGIPGFLVDQSAEARSHAVFDAPPADGAERFPVIVFSPGLTGTRTANTVLAEEWAARGYVVATVDHAYDAALTVIDGEPVHSRNSIAGLTDAEIAQQTRDNLATRAADLSFVLSELERLDQGEGPLAGRLDTGRAAVAGHSRGAAAALMTAAADPRFAAVVHIDGGLEPSLPPGPFDQPALSITSPVSAAENPDYIPNLERALELGTGERYRIEIAGAGHFSFTDAALYFPPLPSVLGTVGREEGLRLTAEATTAFLDAALRGQPTDLPGLLSQYGELTVYN
jgi:dienelactone hydrolase